MNRGRSHKLIYLNPSWSSSSAASTDFPDPLLPLVSLVHCFRQVFQATSCIDTELLCIGFSWSSNLSSSMCNGPLVNITDKFALTSPAVFHMSCSSNLDNYGDRCKVASQLLFCMVLPPRHVQYSMQQSCVIAVKLFLQTFC